MAKGWRKLAGIVVPLLSGVALAIILGFLLPSCCQGPTSAGPAGQGGQPARSTSWAAPIQRPGLPNFHKVSDNLYRGAQPTAEGLVELKKMGIKTVVNLRAEHSDRELLGQTGLGYVSIPMHAWHPEEEDIVAFLRVVTDPSKTPVFVHCEHGADRTGEQAAAYRVAVQGWSVDDAVREMFQGGFGFHDIWRGRIGGYLKELDYNKIRKEAGIEKEPAAAGAAAARQGGG